MKENQSKIPHLLILSLNHLILKNLHSQMCLKSHQDSVNDRHHQLLKYRVSQVADNPVENNKIAKFLKKYHIQIRLK